MLCFDHVYTDFNLLTSQVTITETMTEPCVSFQAIADGLGLEGVENLTLSLSGPPNVQLTTASLHICIQDSDGKDYYNVIGKIDNDDDAQAILIPTSKEITSVFDSVCKV